MHELELWVTGRDFILEIKKNLSRFFGDAHVGQAFALPKLDFDPILVSL
jgi:hypothetical protein